MTTTTPVRITLDADADAFLTRYLQLFAVGPDNETTCEACDLDIRSGLAYLVSLDADMSHPVVMHPRHFETGDPHYVPFVAHLD